ncbi:polysaccharide biosynthesis protein [Aquipluma nitroreducens]|uniref:Polysaccharide biosynthesis protein n=1 Tax=Aquipluma nitroreducens TaxID=2010828 RepID=A0A5K7S426_9BACT|nr:oligosaccharide flippase family protein [Aquipluma nitroreducens]BBE16225.1 polysaccharide biosynthesis protein [Aquipluma nitroreducens]
MFLDNITKTKLFKQTFTYTIINILEKSMPFLIMPILTRVISKDGMGYYTLYQTLFNILIPILTLSIDSAILVNFYKQSKESFPKYFSTGIYFSLAIYLIGLITGITFSESLSKLFGLPTIWIQLTMVIVLLQFFSELRKNLWRVSRQPLQYGYYSVPLTFSKNIIGLIFVFYFGYGWEGIILGHFIGQIIFSIYGIISFIKEGYIQKCVEIDSIKDMIKFGVPISIHRIGAWLSNALNRVLLNSIIGVAATGSYGVGATFGVIITVIGDAISKAYVPFLYEKLKIFNEKTSVQLVKLIYGYYGFYLILTFIMFIVGYYGVGLIFGEKYLDTRAFVFPVILSATINGLYKIHVDFISFTKKTYLIAATTISSGLLNIFIANRLISSHGIIGAAYSAVIIQFLTYIVILYISNKKFKLPWLYFISIK